MTEGVGVAVGGAGVGVDVAVGVLVASTVGVMVDVCVGRATVGSSCAVSVGNKTSAGEDVLIAASEADGTGEGSIIAVTGSVVTVWLSTVVTPGEVSVTPDCEGDGCITFVFPV